jgi:hypothetical protein
VVDRPAFHPCPGADRQGHEQAGSEFNTDIVAQLIKNTVSFTIAVLEKKQGLDGRSGCTMNGESWDLHPITRIFNQS